MVLWKGRNISVWFSTSGTATSAAEFDTTSGTDYAGFFKTVEFKEPETVTGEEKLLGTTSGNANSETFTEDPTFSEVTGDLVLTPKNGETVDIDELFYTYTGSDPKVFNYAATKLTPSVFLRFGDDTNYVGFILKGVNNERTGGLQAATDESVTANGFKITASANNTRKEKAGTYAA